MRAILHRKEGPGRGWWGPPKGTHTAANAGEKKEPRWIKTTQEADGWLSSTFKGWTGDLSDEEKRAVQNYTGSVYQAQNSFLRGKWDADVSERAVKQVQEDNRMLDSAFARGVRQTTAPLVVFRGGGRQIADLPVGAEFTDKGFLSTSLLVGEAQSFVKRTTLSRIFVPAGKRMLPGTRWEYEVIFPRDTQFRVLFSEKRNQFGSKPFTYVELEML